MSKINYPIAKILDATWWQEEVPVGFTNRTYPDQDDVEQVYTFEQYLGKFKRNYNSIEFALFSQITLPQGYSNSKIEFVHSDYYYTQVAAVSENPDGVLYYRIYEVLPEEMWQHKYKAPVTINFKTATIKGLYPKITTENNQMIKREWYLDEELTRCAVQEDFTYSNNIRNGTIKWVKIDDSLSTEFKETFKII